MKSKRKRIKDNKIENKNENNHFKNNKIIIRRMNNIFSEESILITISSDNSLSLNFLCLNKFPSLVTLSLIFVGLLHECK